MKADVDVSVAIQGIPRIGAPGVRAGRAAEAAWVVRVEEPIVSLRVGPELRVVIVGAQDQRGSALPATHHLGAQTPLLFPV